MAPALNDPSREYYTDYSATSEAYERLAATAQAFVASALKDGGVAPHAVMGRAKDPASVLRKLRRRVYLNPKAEVTDLIGVRVITYYRDEVDRVVDVLRPRLTLDTANSVDKRRQLDLREFGYRSVHLIAKLADIGIEVPEEYADVPLEIQVRSILEHAWAENEHEIVYKSGIDFPRTTSRGFAAVAGALELLDQEFERFRVTVEAEVTRRSRQLAADPSAWTRPFDAASLIATLESLAPNNPGWQGGSGSLPPKSAALAQEALISAGLTTPHAIRLAFATDKFTSALANFASLTGVTTDEVSHLAICALLAATQAGFIADDYPDLLNDPTLLQALGSG